jgi:RNA polymerase sigma factor (sigma-70 family)
MSSSEFAEVYEQHVSKVYGFFGYAVRDRADAEDLTQQTFERALKAWDGYDQLRGESSKWLMVIARNLFVDHLRATRSLPAQPVEVEELERMPAAPDRHNLGLEPELERALAELEPRARELLALRFGADLAGAEIADLTGLSLDNVQQILSRSLRRMRASLDGAAREERWVAAR